MRVSHTVFSLIIHLNRILILAPKTTTKTSFWADGGELQYYYIHGPHMMDVVKSYHILTGTHPMPPLWALGYHQCRWSYYPEAKVKK